VFIVASVFEGPFIHNAYATLFNMKLTKRVFRNYARIELEFERMWHKGLSEKDVRRKMWTHRNFWSKIFCNKKFGRPHLKNPCPQNVRNGQPLILDCGRILWTAPNHITL